MVEEKLKTEISLRFYQQKQIQNKVQRRKQQKEMLFEEIPLTQTKHWKDSHASPLLNLAAIEASLLSYLEFICYYVQIHKTTHFLLSTNDHHHSHGQNFKGEWRNLGCFNKDKPTHWLGNNFTRMYSFSSAFIHQLTVTKANVFLKYWTCLIDFAARTGGGKLWCLPLTSLQPYLYRHGSKKGKAAKVYDSKSHADENIKLL